MFYNLTSIGVTTKRFELIYMILFLQCILQVDRETEIRTHARGVGPPGGRGIQYRTVVRADAVRQKQHPGADQLPEQQEAAGSRQGIRSTLQHGAGKRQGNVDGSAPDRQGQEKGETGQQGSLHFENVFARRFGNFGFAQSIGNFDQINT